MGSPSLNIKGIHPRTEEWEQMNAVYQACLRAKVPIPDRVQEFFDWRMPDEKGVVIDLDLNPAVEQYSDGEGQEGFDVELAKLPKHITHIRFYLHW